jgi:hypothetical protein
MELRVDIGHLVVGAAVVVVLASTTAGRGPSVLAALPRFLNLRSLGVTAGSLGFQERADRPS